MSDVQQEQYTKINNNILEKFAQIKLSPTQYRLLFVIMRQTFGFHRNSHKFGLGVFERTTGCDKRSIQRDLKKLEDKNIIIQEVKNGVGRIIGINQNVDEWRDDTLGETANGQTANGRIANGQTTNVTLGETANTPLGQTANGTLGETANLERKELKKDIKENIKENIYILFEHWNSKGIISHKKITDIMKRHINARLEEYDLEIIKKAIDNYVTVLNDDMYYWSHKWTLQDFMKPNNLIRFTDEADPLHTFLKNKNEKGNGQQSQSEYFKMITGKNNNYKPNTPKGAPVFSEEDIEREQEQYEISGEKRAW